MAVICFSAKTLTFGVAFGLGYEWLTMVTDPNWLFSTAAQSAAALVAIIAGFIVSRLLALSADRNSLKSRVNEIDLEIGSKRRELEPIKRRILESDADDFIQEVFDQILSSKGEMKLEDAMAEIGRPQALSEAELRPFWDETVEPTKEAFMKVREYLFRNTSKDLNGYLEEVGLDDSDKQWIHCRVFEHVEDEIERTKMNVINERFSASRLLGGAIGLSGRYRPPEIQLPNNEYHQWTRDAELLERQLSNLEASREHVDSQVRNFAKPPGLWFGFITLLYFSLVGIIFPLVLMAYKSQGYSRTILILFVSALVVFFTFLSYLARQLSK